MDHIQQLKQIRSDAIARIRASSDFKLAGKLGALIVELGDHVEDQLDYDSKNDGKKAAPFSDVAGFKKPDGEVSDSDEDDDMVDELVAGMKDEGIDVPEKKSATNVIGPFIKPPVKAEKTDEKRANGSSR